MGVSVSTVPARDLIVPAEIVPALMLRPMSRPMPENDATVVCSRRCLLTRSRSCRTHKWSDL
jgi:hypothetical protein